MGELTPIQQRAVTLRELLEKRKGEIQLALPKHMHADRLVRIALTAVVRQPKLLNCTPESVYYAVMQSAQLGLEPDLMGQAYLVPYYNKRKQASECQFIPGYQGLLSLARRSDKIAKIVPRAVHTRDFFSYEYGLQEKLEHRPPLDDDPNDELVWVYAIAWMKECPDSPYFDVMSVADVQKIRQRSKTANDGPWVTDFEAMALKTILRRLCKYLPTAVDDPLRRAIALDERAEAGLPQALDVEFEPEASGQAPPGEGPQEEPGGEASAGTEPAPADHEPTGVSTPGASGDPDAWEREQQERGEAISDLSPDGAPDDPCWDLEDDPNYSEDACPDCGEVIHALTCPRRIE